jgi:broad specificity phosphatase PhoE
MKIGLVRHFKVKHDYPKKFLVGYDEIVRWFDHYNVADIEPRDVGPCGVTWEKCYASSLPRALQTARCLFSGDVIPRDDLTELNLLPLMNNYPRLPLLLWALLLRRKFRSSNPITDAFAAKMGAFVDELLRADEGNVLVASHGFVMMFLQKELLRRGFTGERFNTPAHGKIYVFVK